MTTQTNPTDTSRVFDEFSPRKAILQAKSLGEYILSKWKQIILVALIFGIGGAIRTYLKKSSYVAEITFTLDEGASQGAGGGGIAELGAQLGLGMPANAGGIFSSMTNIVELMQSRLLIEKTLKKQVTIYDKPVLFADFFLDSLGYRSKWMKGSPYYQLDFMSVKKDKKEELFQNNITENIYLTILNKSLKISPKGKGTTILSVTCISEHELFSKYFLEALIEEVSAFYIETKTQRAKNNLNFIQKRTDSTRIAYNQSLYGRAAFTDANVNPNLKIATVTGEKQQTDVQLLSASYTELVRSLEAAKTTLMRETPLIQLLDTPILPLKKIAPSVTSSFILFFVVGGFLAVFYFVCRKVLSYIMQS